MTNTEISDNNPEKELKIDKSISDDKTKEISKKNTTQNKKITPKNDKSTKSFDEISNEIFRDLFSKKDFLVKEIKELETKKNEIEKDIESNFKGQSDNIAKRVKGFQEYLTGALQNLSQNVERLELVSQPIIVKPSPLDEKKQDNSTNNVVNVPALSETFKPDKEIIKSCFTSFTAQPDFYAEPWKLRRSLDSSDIEIMDDWFFNMGGRGSLESRGSRQKNALLSAGLISILGELYGDQFQTLILASQPERLGEWRRILQDSLGLTRDDFGPNSGIVLFERPEGVIERADRLEANEELPFIIIDAAETSVEIPILQFPLWVAFAGSDNEIYDDLELN
ncbi:DUF3086 domain-containing protein [Prochlorococcus marinus XMU1414]|uniref:DUF3086 domain-containing protein n=1 Tax=Prochlorococcus marinus XMU1424 TaxID=2774497 RepID=A0A9D9BVS0_PROMR|nr:DUF3086 domain-containing protein [Prochlorococcus marinus]MBO8228753.1 DUF3086 domain-containing protein [Prochlorococcus marinus XMU1414]MBW3046233.1 DUF3086 domain-containing protein [Prochlorococcus marinus str. MU1414]MCR8531477.1 DUF3086 domain-containing protein [Prochlorococcus marinus XMU1420]MCR8535205.1 DUF3086 domain-containing protein [Prochlorococcus marinus XMU1424]